MATHEIMEFTTEHGEEVHWSQDPAFRTLALAQLRRPTVVDIGGEEDPSLLRFTGGGSRIITRPSYGKGIAVYEGFQRLCVAGQHDGVDLPAGTANSVEANMIVTHVTSLDYSPTQVVLDTITTARAIAAPGAQLEIIDLLATLTTVARYLQVQGYSIGFRPINLGEEDDHHMCATRSHHALYMREAEIGYLVVML